MQTDIGNLFYSESVYKALCHGGDPAGLWPQRKRRASGKDGSGDSALEYFCYGRNGRDCCPERKCLSRKGRKTIFEEAPCLKKGLEELGFTVYPSEANYIFFRGEPGLFEKGIRNGVIIRDCGNYPGLTEGFLPLVATRIRKMKGFWKL